LRSTNWLRMALVVAAACGFIAAIVLSPALMMLLPGSDNRWRHLSDIGQAYGSVSAILSSLALLGVAATTFMQVRQAKVAEIQMFRQLHAQLVSIEMGDPGTFVPAKSNISPADEVAYRRRTYAALWLNYVWSMFDTGFKEESGIRSDMRAFFGSPIARAIWVAIRPFWQENLQSTAKGRRFMNLMDEHYTVALNSAPAPAHPPYIEAGRPGPHGPRHNVDKGTANHRVTLLVIGIGLGSLLHRAVSRRRRGQPRPAS
jgi:hypothetical protein